MSYNDHELSIRPFNEDDVPVVWKLMYKEEEAEWTKWDAPYFNDEPVSYEECISKKDKLIHSNSRWVIEVDGNVIGTVSYYWEHEPSRWIEMGIGIYDPAYWNGGYGTRAIRLWINHLFNTLPLIARVGYTTWSGNERMMKVGEKLGMTLEARLRKCRYYNGTYYDSIRMGLLREEWEQTLASEMVE
ncbi:GNAT family N-acetyltransferase [Anaerobacillus isosaccharinicus]|uniref:GNAT family N-acetyltransferase n=1 Tax=Anaerobacillus isosaccharinicus TaxID=1532552 RepID=A0A1S2LH38_9BACI|nr:GNAT family protein [Anaerobacillus isosaccharinicus]MBA5586282.1 GNAT family N-acetyltransferase [Anaerobacillus isosaccharinicus]QOY35467.1 GNAT family N-acetyltransferase [Anaerobacillus isosaccharinicus]